MSNSIQSFEILTLLIAVTAVLVAIFRDWFRVKLFSPNLSVTLDRQQGYLADIDLLWSDEDGTHHSRKEKARFYHLNVKNTRRWSKAQQVQLFLVAVEVHGEGGTVQESWTGNIPLRWRYQESNPLVQTIGHEAQCDLCTVVRGKWLELNPLFRPDELPGPWKDAVTVHLSLQLRSLEIDLEPMKIGLIWDGKWEDGEIEIKRHFMLKVPL